MSATKSACITLAEFGVITAPTFGDIVEEGCDVDEPRLRKIRHELAAEGILMRVLGNRKPAHVAQYHQDVLINGIDMKQVMLHLPDDAAKRRQVAAEYRQLIHVAQRMRNTLGCFEYLQEQLAVGRGKTESRTQTPHTAAMPPSHPTGRERPGPAAR